MSSAHSGRSIPDPAYAGDDGVADPSLMVALEAYRADPARLPEVLAALHSARVLAAVVALPGGSGTVADGLDRDRGADIAVPLLLDAGGVPALPVFTDLAALARWDPTARPVPVSGPRAARVALAEAADAMVLDVAGPRPVALPQAELRALAEGRGTVPAWLDPEVAAAVGTVLDGEPAARSGHLSPSAGRDARLTVVLGVGAHRAVVADRLAAAVATLPVLRTGIHEVVVTVS